MGRTCMSFQSEKAREFLLKNGFVFTFRTKKKEIGPIWINEGRGKPKIANARIVWELEVDGSEIDPREDLKTELLLKLALEPYVSGSGFEDGEEWVNEIRRLNTKLPRSGWIYLVLLEVES